MHESRWCVWTAVVLTVWCIVRKQNNTCMFTEVNLSLLSKYCDIELRHPNITMFAVSYLGFVNETYNFNCASCRLYTPEHISNSANSQWEASRLVRWFRWPCSNTRLCSGFIHTSPHWPCIICHNKAGFQRGQHNALNPITEMTGWSLPRRRRVFFCSLWCLLC